MLRYILGFLLITGTFINTYATHVVGGSLNYEHLGGSTYRITLKVYRDCQGINAPGSVVIRVRDINGNAFSPSKDIVISSFYRDTLKPYIDTCAFNPGICVEERIFTKVVNNLPAGAGGYHLYWQTCCRNGSIVNINNPLGTGSTFYAFIPDNATLLTNSNPTFKNFPPVFICKGQPLVFDHSASDKDGDSLVYKMYSPNDDNPPNFAFNPPNFGQVTWLPGFTQNQPLGGTSWNINPQTGIITVTPPSVGQFVVGIMVEEWRDQKKIGTTTRDFQFNVLNCPPPANPYIGPIDGCNGFTITFTNASDSAANDFFWNFGDPGTLADTSHLKTPTWTYPGYGTYTVMLVAQAGTKCADTTYRTFTIGDLQEGFTNNPDSVCQGIPISFQDTSKTTTGTVNFWKWNFGDGSGSNSPSPSHAYGSGGTYTVTLIVQTTEGCVDSIQKQVFVQAQPIANAGNDTTACINSPQINLSGYSSTGTGQWVAPGTFNPSNTSLGATYTPTAGEISGGQAIIALITTNNGLCPAGEDTLIVTFVPGPTADAGNDIYVCKDTAYVPLSGLITVATGGVWSSSGTGTFTPDDTLRPGGKYLPSSADTAAGSVQLILRTIGNGNCVANADTIMLYFTNPPSISITVPDSICAGYPLNIQATTTTGQGVWNSSGTGTFNPGDSSLNTTYNPSSGDTATGSFLIKFKSLNNGGCKPQYDSVMVNIIPTPVADFFNTDVCMNQLTMFFDSTKSKSAIGTWNWDFAGEGTSNQQNPSHQFDTSGTHTVRLIVQSNNGCIDTVTKQVTVYNLPIANFLFDGICMNEEQMFYDSSTVDGSTINRWQWDFGDNSGDSVQNPGHYYGADGSYNVRLIAISAQGCRDTVVKSITVHPGPTADYTADRYAMLIGEQVKFTDKSVVNIVAWDWNFGDGLGNSTVQNPTYQYGNKGTYPVTLVVTDNVGCTDTVTYDFFVYMPPEVPSGFSPNGDGNNDVLFVYGGPFKEFRFEIWNNWGELLFTSTDQSIGWDGTKDGVLQPVGVYVWQVTAVTVDGFEGKEEIVHQKKGDVTLLR